MTFQCLSVVYTRLIPLLVNETETSAVLSPARFVAGALRGRRAPWPARSVAGALRGRHAPWPGTLWVFCRVNDPIVFGFFVKVTI
jgi:hypothetical protein